MKEDANYWLNYAVENLDAAKVLLNSHFYNPCLQNVQQIIESRLDRKVITIEENT